MKKNLSKHVEQAQMKSVAATELTKLDLEYVGGGTGHIATASGECNTSGRSCGTVRGLLDQATTWLLT